MLSQTMEEFNSLETKKFGTFGENMLDASDLVRTNRMTHLRRSGTATGTGAEDRFIFIFIIILIFIFIINVVLNAC